LAKRVARHAVLSETETFDEKENLRVVIETPKGSRVKYAYDPACDCFVLKTVMPCGMSFPYDFGFIPSTLAEDGDPVDVLVLMDFAVVPGCILGARPVGVIKAEQKANGSEWERNDRLIAVAAHARTHDHVHSVKDLPSHLLDEIMAFFVNYNELHNKKFRPLDNGGPQKALEMVQAGRAQFAKRQRGNRRRN
jgi:inorganic pyrophosphatase